ncbi:hypothetical protein BC828DRAFT_420433 [Blastocladiella britannica]|nr:hypothetical protein BC828DRAFT_420433 [Blastocladiella britannica]
MPTAPPDTGGTAAGTPGGGGPPLIPLRCPTTATDFRTARDQATTLGIKVADVPNYADNTANTDRALLAALSRHDVDTELASTVVYHETAYRTFRVYSDAARTFFLENGLSFLPASPADLVVLAVVDLSVNNSYFRAFVTNLPFYASSAFLMDTMSARFAGKIAQIEGTLFRGLPAAAVTFSNSAAYADVVSAGTFKCDRFCPRVFASHASAVDHADQGERATMFTHNLPFDTCPMDLLRAARADFGEVVSAFVTPAPRNLRTLKSDGGIVFSSTAARDAATAAISDRMNTVWTTVGRHVRVTDSPKAVACYRCRMMGHTAANCPTPFLTSRRERPRLVAATPVGVMTPSAMHSAQTTHAGTSYASVVAASPCSPAATAATVPSSLATRKRVPHTHDEAVHAAMQCMVDGMIAAMDADNHTEAKKILGSLRLFADVAGLGRATVSGLVASAMMGSSPVAALTPTKPTTTTMAEQRPVPARAAPLKRTNADRRRQRRKQQQQWNRPAIAGGFSAGVGRDLPGGSSDRCSSVAFVGDARALSDQQQCRGPDGSGSVPDADDRDGSGNNSSRMSGVHTLATVDAEPDPADAMIVDDIEADPADEVPPFQEWTAARWVLLASIMGCAILIEEGVFDEDDSDDDGDSDWEYDEGDDDGNAPGDCSRHSADTIERAKAAAFAQRFGGTSILCG